jgi:hypothetical protein
MDAFLQFLTGELTVVGITVQNWMLLASGIIVAWIAAQALKL